MHLRLLLVAALLPVGGLFSQVPAPVDPLRDNGALPETPPTALSFGAVADRVLPSLVSILAPGTRAVPGAPLPAVGSGFIVSSDGRILTTEQAIGGPGMVEVAVRQNGSVRVYPARVLTVDDATGAALLKIEAAGLPEVALGSSADLRAGDVAYAASATSTNLTLVQGSITGMRRQRGRGANELIETNIAVIPMEVGSPLVDASGRVIGMNVPSPPARAGRPLGFAMPIDEIAPLLQNVAQPTVLPPGVPSSRRGFLGVQIGDLPPAPTPPGVPAMPRGAAVQLVGAGSPAESAGVQVGDIIVGIDGEAISEGAQMRDILSTRPPGVEVTLDVIRAGRRMSLTAMLTDLPAAASAGTPTSPSGIPLVPEMPSLPPVGSQSLPSGGPAMNVASAPAEMLPGLTVDAVTPELRARQAVPPDISGVIVTSAAPDSRAVAMGVEQGDVITQVNRRPVTTAQEARDLVQQGEKTVLLKVYRKGDTMLFMVTR